MLIPSELNRFTAPAAAPPPDLSAVPEPELVRAARGGDDAAFGEIYRRYHNRLTRFACLYLQNWGDAEDVAQTVLVKAWRVIADGDERPADHLGTWLHRSARNRCIDVLRQRRTRPAVSAEHWCERHRQTAPAGSTSSRDDEYAALDLSVWRLEAEHEPDLRVLRPSWRDDPAEAAERSERAAVIRAAVRRFPGRYRAYLREHTAGASQEEIAARHGVTLSTVKGALYRARIALRQMPEVAALAPGR